MYGTKIDYILVAAIADLPANNLSLNTGDTKYIRLFMIITFLRGSLSAVNIFLAIVFISGCYCLAEEMWGLILDSI